MSPPVLCEKYNLLAFLVNMNTFLNNYGYFGSIKPKLYLKDNL